jgi:DNA-binding transcriptional LysR family regulator
MVILLPERHPLAKFRQLPLAALANEKLVLFPRQAGVEWFDEIIASCRQSGFEPILGLEAPQITSVSNLVAAGLGVSLVPLSVASQIQKTGTCSVKIKGKSPVARLSLAVRADHSSVVLKNFEALVRSLKK